MEETDLEVLWSKHLSVSPITYSGVANFLLPRESDVLLKPELLCFFFKPKLPWVLNHKSLIIEMEEHGSVNLFKSLVLTSGLNDLLKNDKCQDQNTRFMVLRNVGFSS